MTFLLFFSSYCTLQIWTLQTCNLKKNITPSSLTFVQQIEILKRLPGDFLKSVNFELVIVHSNLGNENLQSNYFNI